jgi:thiol-disulfide isomerase/thioredoxin
MRFTVLATLAFLFAGCTDPATEARITELEAKVAAQQATIDKLSAGGGAAGGAVDAEAEKAAAQLIRDASDAMRQLNYDVAKTKLAELKAKYPTTRAARSAEQLEQQLAVIGKPVSDLAVEKWYTSNQTTFNDGKATLVVFFEEWCPHCKREVPKLTETYSTYNSKGLNMVGLTKITKSSTEEKVVAFVKDNNLNYPIAKEDGKLSEAFAVQGIPAAAVVKGGQIVWRGHPAQITPEMIDGWIGS